MTFVDEKVNEVETYTLVLSQVHRLMEHVERDEQAPAELRSGLDALEAFIRNTKLGPRSLETPTHNPDTGASLQSSRGSRPMRQRGGREVRWRPCGTHGARRPARMT